MQLLNILRKTNMKKLLFCVLFTSFILGCVPERNTFSGLFIGKDGSKISFKNMHIESGIVNDVYFVSEGRSLEFSLNDVKEIYLVTDDAIKTNDKDIIKELPQGMHKIKIQK